MIDVKSVYNRVRFRIFVEPRSVLLRMPCGEDFREILV